MAKKEHPLAQVGIVALAGLTVVILVLYLIFGVALPALRGGSGASITVPSGSSSTSASQTASPRQSPSPVPHVSPSQRKTSPKSHPGVSSTTVAQGTPGTSKIFPQPGPAPAPRPTHSNPPVPSPPTLPVPLPSPTLPPLPIPAPVKSLLPPLPPPLPTVSISVGPIGIHLP
jgi:hypothetical protein